jgi:hypothetical protein
MGRDTRPRLLVWIPIALGWGPGQSGEGHFEQLWNQLIALRKSKLLGSRSGRNNRIKKPFTRFPWWGREQRAPVVNMRPNGFAAIVTHGVALVFVIAVAKDLRYTALSKQWWHDTC